MSKTHIFFFCLLAGLVFSACASQPTPAPSIQAVFVSPTPAFNQTNTEAVTINGPAAQQTATLPPLPTATAPSLPSVTPTFTPTLTPIPSAAPLPLATEPPPMPTPGVTLGNLQGQIMVLEYHLFEAPNDAYRRAPDSFRADVQRLYDLGYYPANIIDLSDGFTSLPPGKKPLILTFDDSDISQFNLLPDGTIDPDSAVGILYNFHLQHPDDWPLRGTFYILQEVDAPQRIIFGQPELAQQKLQWLVDNGFEVASHTISHFDLSGGTDEQVQWQLAESQWGLEALLPGYDVRSLSAPFGNFPANTALLAQGVWQGQPYSYANTVMAWGGPSPSPYRAEFDPYRIPRIPVTDAELNYWLDYIEQNPGAYYVTE